MDEDGPEDLNKDGVITVMRVKDPAGDYMIDPDDPRTQKAPTLPRARWAATPCTGGRRLRR